MRIAVIGTGYVGLVAGTCLADTGNDVVCVDVDQAKIDTLRAGKIPIYEPGLAELVTHNLAERRLRFETDLAAAVARAEIVFIAVGTPTTPEGAADVTAVLAVAEAVGRALQQYTVIVLKSTVPVGTGEKVRAALAGVAGAPFDVVSNPEFLKEGSAVDDFLRPDRVIIGTESEKARGIMGELYAPYVRTEKPVLYMDSASAELTKYAANAMLALRISFMNEVALLCERLGADVDQVRKGVGADTRIGYPFLFPGVGFGGSCFPKDLAALVATSESLDMDPSLLKAAQRINERQKRLLVDRARSHFAAVGGLAGRRIAVWGLSFKPKTDDMREAPSLRVIEGLLADGAQVAAHDPAAEGVARAIFGERIEYCAEPYAAARGADALFVVTEWNEFRRPDFDRLRAEMRTPVIFDGRNIYDPARMRERGFTYYGVGRR